MGSIREERFEVTAESFTLAVVDAGGEPRELHLAVEVHLSEPDGIRLTVFHGTEHALIPLDDGQARELARWLLARVGLPPGWEHTGGQLRPTFGPNLGDDPTRPDAPRLDEPRQ